jgi:hypothetical protein
LRGDPGGDRRAAEILQGVLSIASETIGEGQEEDKEENG